MTTYRFDRVSKVTTKHGKCPVCGKQVTRRLTLSYNLNADGTQKTALTIYEELDRETAAWEPNFTHQKCEDKL